MDLFRTYKALTSSAPPEHLRRAGAPFAVATALSVLSRTECAPLFALNLQPEDMDARYPADTVPRHARVVFKLELTRYLGWRRTVFDTFLLETGTPIDQDIVSALMRIARLEIPGNSYQHLRTLRRALSDPSNLHSLGREDVLLIDRHLSAELRRSFRIAFSVLDRLQTSALAKGSRLILPAEVIGRLPAPSSHLYHAPLPQRLQRAYSEAPTVLRAAIPFVYRLCCITGVLDQSADPSLDELADQSRHLWDVDPENHGFQRPTKSALKQYIRNIGKHVSTHYSPPRCAAAAVSDSWTILRTQLRISGKENLAQRTFGVSRFAIPAGLAPHALTADWFRKTADGLGGSQRRALRSGAFALDALRQEDAFPRGLLPLETSGLERERRQRSAPRTSKGLQT